MRLLLLGCLGGALALAVACDDEEDGAGGGGDENGASSGDAAAPPSSSGAPTSSGAPFSSSGAPSSSGAASSSGGPSSSSGNPVEPGCVLDPAAIPAWTEVDPHLDAWSGAAPADGSHASGVGGLAYGNGLWVLVPAHHTAGALDAAVSPDGVTWTPTTSVLPADFNQVSKLQYERDRFVVFFDQGPVGGPYTLWASTTTDGANWTQQAVSSGASEGIGGFATQGGTTVAISTNGAIYTSQDLLTWNTVRTHSLEALGWQNALAAGGGHFVVSWGQSDTDVFVETSADGTTWTPSSGAPHPGYRAYVPSFGGGHFVLSAVKDGYLAVSDDGADFTPVAPAGPNYGGGGWFLGNRFVSFVSLDAATIQFTTSSDGITSAPYGTAPVAGFGPQSYVAYGQCKYLVAGFATRADVQKPFLLSAAAAPAP